MSIAGAVAPVRSDFENLTGKKAGGGVGPGGARHLDFIILRQLGTNVNNPRKEWGRENFRILKCGSFQGSEKDEVLIGRRHLRRVPSSNTKLNFGKSCVVTAIC